MGGELILAIDNGTQSVRALLFDLRGNLIAKSRVPIEPYFSDAPGLAEQYHRSTGTRCARRARDCGAKPGSPKKAWRLLR